MTRIALCMCRGMTDREKQMKKVGKHVILWMALFMVAAVLEYAVYLHYDSLREHPIILNRYLEIKPVYNMDGSWLHGRLGIEYNGLLLCLENIAALLVAAYLFRMIASYNAFFGLSAGWVYVIDLEIMVPIFRLADRLFRPYTLDYLRVRGYGTFDFPDFCLGTGLAGVLLWLIPALCRYYRYKKEKTVGMGFVEKLKWEFRMSGRILYVPFVKRSGWEERFEKWRAEGK